MKRIPVSSTGLSVEEENNEVRVGTDSINRPLDITICVPVHTSLKLSAVNSGDILVTGVDGELDVNDVNGSVTLNSVSGSAIAHALNGRVLVTLTRVNQKPMTFSSQVRSWRSIQRFRRADSGFSAATNDRRRTEEWWQVPR